MVATIATRQLHSSFSPFPIEEEERTIFELHAMVNRFQIFLPSLSLPIFEYFRNCGREREKDGMATIATRQLHSSSSPFPIEEEERTSLFQQDFIPLFQQFSSCTMVNRFQIFLPFLPLPIFEIVDCFN